MSFISDMWHGDWIERTMAVFLGLTAVAVIVLIVMSPWIYRAEKRETERLIAAGCKIVDTRTVFVYISNGRSTTIIPQSHDIWECPDGTRIER